MSNESETHELRPAQRQRGRRLMISFELVNTFSFTLLAGNLITLLMLRLGANSTLIGLLGAFPYIAFFFMPFAKNFVPRFGLVRIFGFSWTMRYVAIIPIVVAPFLVAAGQPQVGIVLVVSTYFLFQMSRGFGLVSISPLNNEYSAGKDRGAWLSRKLTVSTASSIAASLLVSIFLGKDSPVERYAVFMIAGILLGFVGCAILFRIPEPPGVKEGARSGFFADVKASLAQPDFVRFLLAFAAFYFVSNLGRPFLIVYAKEVAHFGDDSAMLLSVVASLGAILMTFLSRTVLDKLGAKPLFIVFTLVLFLATVPLGFLGGLDPTWSWIVLSVLFFFASFGGAGGENSSQAYFFGFAAPESQFNLGMLYYLVLGFAGGLGSFLGGTALDGLHAALGASNPDSTVWTYRIFFAIVALLCLIVVVLLSRMATLGARSVSETISTLFSPRELRNISLLNRLNSAGSLEEEREILKAIPGSDSDIAVGDVVKRLRSPVYALRAQALLTLERFPATPEAEAALIDHVQEHQFGTAARAARILGELGLKSAIPVLRQAVKSEDYLLTAYAIGALGELGDEESRPLLEEALKKGEDFLVEVHVLTALKRFGNEESIPAILGVFARMENPPQLRDEAVFSLAGICGMDAWFYPRYTAFNDQPETGIAMLVDDVMSHGGHEELLELLRSVAGGEGFVVLARTCMKKLEPALRPVAHAYLEQSLNQDTSSPSYRFFIASYCVRGVVQYAEQ